MGTTTARAKELGREYRSAYRDEFGHNIDPLTCGDWDSTAWGEAIRQLKNEEGLDARDPEDTRAAGLAFRDGLFGPA